MVKVTAAGTKRVSFAGVLGFRPGAADRPRLIHRSIVYHGRKNQKKGFDEHDYIRLLDAALDPRQSRRHSEPLRWLVYGG
ncbi:hypothetical protein [Actinospica robiniae]|uniref:hypothetical protein n=1 Tax=Actinospica robiniae TaxID=304901 RepID=UPI0012F7BA39|nr:hypothetical protein [Actinospica robiniae]